jgi:hypothetical protein
MFLFSCIVGLNALSMLLVAACCVFALGSGPVLLFLLSFLRGTIRKSGWGICMSSFCRWVLFFDGVVLLP